MLTSIIHDMIKFYGTNKDFDVIAPAITHLLAEAVSHSDASAYAVTEACNQLLADDKTDINALMRLRNICVDLNLASRMIRKKGEFTQLCNATRIAKLL
jgi:hypothetical protein